MAKPKTPPVKKEASEKRDIPAQLFSPSVMGVLADEVARTMMTRLPNLFPQPTKKKKPKKVKKLTNPLILDTSAIIDRRILDVMHLGLLDGDIVVPEGVLLELKHLADSQDTVKRQRGRSGLEELEKVKKIKAVKFTVLPDEANGQRRQEVDETLIKVAKQYKGKVLTCDYNLEKKASIQNAKVVNVNALAHALKIIAVPGEAVHIQLQHPGKDPTQGVGYLDDGTMIVVEQGSGMIGKAVDVVVSRVIQTAAGKILFAKRI